MRSLLDINVIIALLDPDHDFHHRAHQWWASSRDNGWASCPITENGVIRIMSHPAYNPKRSLSPGDVADLLRTFTTGSNHQFWPDSVSIIDTEQLHAPLILGPRQITDIYLLALAVSQKGCLVTFDEKINHAAVSGAEPSSLLVI